MTLEQEYAARELVLRYEELTKKYEVAIKALELACYFIEENICDNPTVERIRLKGSVAYFLQKAKEIVGGK